MCKCLMLCVAGINLCSTAAAHETGRVEVAEFCRSWGFEQKTAAGNEGTAVGDYHTAVPDAKGIYRKGSGLYKGSFNAANADECAEECSSEANKAGCSAFAYSAGSKSCQMYNKVGASGTYASTGWSFHQKKAAGDAGTAATTAAAGTAKVTPKATAATTERPPTAPPPPPLGSFAAPVVGSKGLYKKGTGEYLQKTVLSAGSTAADCADVCSRPSNDAGCHGFAFDASKSACLMYNEVGAAGTWGGAGDSWTFYKKVAIRTTATATTTTTTTTTTAEPTTLNTASCMSVDNSNVKCAVRLWCDAEFEALPSVDYDDYETVYTNDGETIEYNTKGAYAGPYDVDQAALVAALCKDTGVVYNPACPANSWDVTKVKTMDGLFAEHIHCNLAIDGWRTDSVVDMSGMFREAKAFNQPLTSWRTDAVVDMSGMFSEARAFNQDIDSWQVDSVVDMTTMFYDLNVFNQPLDSWRPDAVKTTENMFTGAQAFNQPLDSWRTSSATSFRYMFKSTGSCEWSDGSDDYGSYNDVSGSYVVDPTRTRECAGFSQNLDSWQTESVTTTYGMFDNAATFNQPLTSWQTGSLETTYTMFESAESFNQNINAWQMDKVTKMANMFYKVSAFNQPLNSWQTESVTSTSSMFYKAAKFNQPLTSWQTDSLEAMKYMFAYVEPFNQNINAWQTGKVKTMGSTFLSAATFNQPLNSWQTSAVGRNAQDTFGMSSMFYEASAFNQNLNSWKSVPSCVWSDGSDDYDYTNKDTRTKTCTGATRPPQNNMFDGAGCSDFTDCGSAPPPPACEGMILWPTTTQDKYLELQSCTRIKFLEIRGGPGNKVVELNLLKKVDDYFKIVNSGTELTSFTALNLEFIGGNFEVYNNDALSPNNLQLPALKSIGSTGGATCNNDVNTGVCKTYYFANNFVDGVKVSLCETNPNAVLWKDVCSATTGCSKHICQ